MENTETKENETKRCTCSDEFQTAPCPLCDMGIVDASTNLGSLQPIVAKEPEAMVVDDTMIIVSNSPNHPFSNKRIMPISGFLYKCPNCGQSQIMHWYNYCPNCGTKIQVKSRELTNYFKQIKR